MVKYHVIAISSKGRYREENEDCLFCADQVLDDEVSVQYLLECDRDIYFAVFDGMGGMDSGKYASKKCCEMLRKLVRKNTCKNDMAEMIERMNRCLCEENHLMGKRMGSTVVLLKLSGSKCRVANLGDSRCYYFGQDVMERISLDHTEAENYRKLMDGSRMDGKILEQMECVLTQHLGVPEEEFIIEPFVSEEREIRDGEMLILCSDGISESEMFSSVIPILSSEGDLKEKAEKAIEGVMDHGGRDNISFMLIKRE